MNIDDFLMRSEFRELDDFLIREMYDVAGKILVGKMNDILEGESNSRNWFYSSLVAFNGRRPYDYCKEGKSEEVRNLLGKIESGIFC